MSLATGPSADDVETTDLDRLEGISLRRREYPEAARHGGAGKFVLDDVDRDQDDVRSSFDVPDESHVPDGSLYQHARGAQYAQEPTHDPVADRDRYVLSREYYHPDDDETDQYAVVMTDSPWKAGTESGGRYSPYYKYDLKLKPISGDGSIDWRHDASRSLNVKIHPQYDNLVYKDGSDLSLPHGEGTMVRVQATWIDDPDELLERAAHLVGHALGYGVRSRDLVRDSCTFFKAEQHYRVPESRESDLVHTVRQSAELLAGHGSDLETAGIAQSDKWLECKIRTSDWHNLGFPLMPGQSAPNILLKVYYADAQENLEYPYDQPKIEVALEGAPGNGVHWSDWERIHAILENILVSHLLWSGVPQDELIADDYSDGAAAPSTTIEHPTDRRAWLRDHYESLVPDLYREATKTNTQLVYDILTVVRESDGPTTYDELVEKTGAARRTIRYHVQRLDDDVGGDDPGILSRVQDAVTFVDFSSRFFADQADDALDEIHPDDQPADRERRADARRDRRERRRDQEDVDDDQESGGDLDDDTDSGSEPRNGSNPESASSDRNSWRYLSDLDVEPDQAATAIAREFVDGDHVRLRTDPYDWLGD